MSDRRELARVAVYSKIKALASSYATPVKIEYENLDAVELSTQADPYLKVFIRYIGGEQVDISNNPIKRRYGHIVLEAWDKVGRGTSKSNKILAHFVNGMERTDAMAPVRTHVADSMPPKTKDGWYAQITMIPMWHDD